MDRKEYVRKLEREVEHAEAELIRVKELLVQHKRYDQFIVENMVQKFVDCRDLDLAK